MSTNIENGIFKAKVDGELKEVRFQTGAENVMVTEEGKEITLAEKLNNIQGGEGNQNITVGTIEPETMGEGDLFIQILSE